MKKTIILLLILIFMTSCQAQKDTTNFDSQHYALIHNLFYEQYSKQISFLKNILSDLLIQNDDFTYLHGELNGYSQQVNVFYVINRNKNPITDKAISPEIYEEIFAIINQTDLLLSKIKELVKSNEKLSVFSDHKPLVLSIVNQLKDINISVENQNEKELQKYKAQLIELDNDIQKLISLM
ncbi:hypothetical protein J2Z32_003150 [Paenibacillus turicensis]|uniref:Uncharacterized protein n=1 Tax=Paenibacillus turicensis TaxID=160487 RepID=A0ABS4FV80_9BACL|nr:hypothetical protein [Paenibacillus turicensis]MBP1906488.1 hypothetical protein [Paenibacillus turicensis]